MSHKSQFPEVVVSPLISFSAGNGAGHLVKTKVGPQHSHALRLPGASAEVGDGEQRQPAGDRPNAEHQERCGEVDHSLCHGI